MTMMLQVKRSTVTVHSEKLDVLLNVDHIIGIYEQANGGCVIALTDSTEMTPVESYRDIYNKLYPRG